MEKVKRVNELYEELDRELDIDECTDRVAECPCDMMNCEVDFKKVEVLNREYDEYFEKKNVILKEEVLKKIS